MSTGTFGQWVAVISAYKLAIEISYMSFFFFSSSMFIKYKVKTYWKSLWNMGNTFPLVQSPKYEPKEKFASKQFSIHLRITIQLLQSLALIKNIQSLLLLHSRGDGSEVKVGRNADGCKDNAEVRCN